MSVNALKPNFNNREGYLEWRNTWKLVYAELSKRIRRRKLEVRKIQSERDSRFWNENAAKAQQELHLMRRDATKMMTLLKEAKALRDRILAMRDHVAQQGFPLDLGDCRNIDFSFNKIAIQFPFMPKWVLKTKGKSFYINHIDAQIAWSTREVESGSTLGMIRFKRAKITIDAEGTASLQ